ncbi:MAG: vitamin K epoxide reductase family protein [Candidatus Pacebacteria bacterium]|nr:vitamin K epoxide reductase family protein [Candidatus Paceibacterota bacterium]
MAPLLPKLLIIFFAFLGFILSFILFHKKRNQESLVCPIGNDCTSVIYSPHSRFFGIEVTLIGMCYYGLTALFYGALIAFPGALSSLVQFFGFIITLCALIFSGYLVIVQGVVLKQWCTWCLGSAFICAVVFGLALNTVYAHVPVLLAEYKTIVVILHAFAAALGVGAVTMTDLFFFKFLKDYRISHDEASIMDTLSDVIWFALVLLVVTGIALYIPSSVALLVSTKFMAKMVVVGVVIVNGVTLNMLVAPKLVKISFGEEHVEHDGEMHQLRRLGFALGAVSLTSWYIVFILGSLRSIPLSSIAILGIYVALLCFAVIGSQVFDRALVRRAHRERMGN